MANLPRKALVDLRCDKLFIDGEEFPWFITEDGISITGLGDRNALPMLSFSILAETVEVIPKEDPLEQESLPDL
jgi:hypothetical protein